MEYVVIQMQFFVPGALIAEKIWKIAGHELLHFLTPYLCGESENNITCAAGCGLAGSWSDHLKSMVGSCCDRFHIGHAKPITFQSFL